MNMDVGGHRWVAVDRVFAEALAYPPDERESFVFERCAEDSGLRELVLELLSLERASEGFLECAPWAVEPLLRDHVVRRFLGLPQYGKRTLASLVIALVGFGFAMPASAQLPWKGTSWRVTCGLDLSSGFGETGLCDDSPPSPSSPNPRPEAIARVQLESASAWLRGLGFSGPAVSFVGDPAADEVALDPLLPGGYHPACVTSYCAQIAELAGNHGTYDYLTGHLRIDPEFMDADWLSADARLTPTHELFHAIQFAYDGMDSSDDADWFTEGSAEYVTMMAARYRDPDWPLPAIPPLHNEFLFPTARFYSESLHEPPASASKEDIRRWSYGSWKFFYYLGEMLGDRSGSQGDRVAYLHDVLSKDLTRNNGLAGLEQAVRALHPEGLYDLFPAFIRNGTTFQKRGHCYFENLGVFDPWPTCKRKTSSSNRLILRVGDDPVQRTGEQVRAMAATAYVLRLEVPPARVGGLEIRASDAEEIHLIVDDERFDDVEPDDLSRERNVALRVIPPGTDSVLVRVVGVPRDVENATGQYGYTIEFSLTELDGCDARTMMSTMRREVLNRAIETVAPTVSGLPVSGPVRTLLPRDRYESEFEPYPGMHPGASWISIAGPIQDQGVACADPVGTNPLLTRNGDELRAEMARRMASMSPADISRIMNSGSRSDSTFGPPLEGAGLDPAQMERAMAMVPEIMGRDGDVLFHIYSPNPISWQYGAHGAFTRGRDAKHGGVGGWSRNASSALTIQLPGIEPGMLKRDSIYQARLLLTEGSSEVLLYSKWDGNEEQTERGRLAIEGRFDEVEARELTGTVTITRLTGAAVHGRFSLSGEAVWKHMETDFNRDVKGRVVGDVCKEEVERIRSVDRVSRPTTKCPEVSEASVVVSGQFEAPAAVEVSRLTRAVAFTHIVQADDDCEGEEIEDCNPSPDPPGCPPDCPPPPPPPEESCAPDCPDTEFEWEPVLLPLDMDEASGDGRTESPTDPGAPDPGPQPGPPGVAPGASSLDFAESSPALSSATFRSARQGAAVIEQMGTVLVTAESFRMLTVLPGTSLAACRSLRPDLPNARISPDEIADRIGTVNLGVFDGEQVNMSFRTTVGTPEYVFTVDGNLATEVQVSPSASGTVAVSVSGAPMTVIRNGVESFYCSAGGDFAATVVR